MTARSRDTTKVFYCQNFLLSLSLKLQIYVEPLLENKLDVLIETYHAFRKTGLINKCTGIQCTSNHKYFTFNQNNFNQILIKIKISVVTINETNHAKS